MAATMTSEAYPFTLPTIYIESAQLAPKRFAGSRPLPSPPSLVVVAPSTLAPTRAGPTAHDDEESPRVISRPKRVTFITNWASGIEPGSPAAPSPLNTPISPLLSAGTQDIARRLLEFAGLPPVRLARAMPPASVAVLAPSHRRSSRLQLVQKLQAPTSNTAPSPSPASIRSPAAALSPVSVSSSVALRQFRVGLNQPPVKRPARHPSSRRAPLSRLASTRRRREVRRSTCSRVLVIAAQHPPAPEPKPAPREVFLDDEEWEFAPLVVLNGDNMPDDDDWEDFDAPAHPASVTPPDSVCSHPSDLDPSRMLPRAQDVRSPVRATPPDSGTRRSPPHSGSSSGAILAIPARSQRRAPHLRKPSYVTAPDDLALPSSPVGPPHLAPLQFPRRRPAPLSIPSPAREQRYANMSPSPRILTVSSLGHSSASSPTRVTVSPLDIQKIRAAFVAGAFMRRPADIGAVPEKALPPSPPLLSDGDKENARIPERGREADGRKGRSRSPRMQGLQSGVRSMLSAVSSLRTGSSSRSSSSKRTWL
ncbi:hypothetical protein K488DRAFT_87602 [Vararia minispora EC-137]|uniref:Uncharacterized protein n=1 Tax=Vararia minispora EC-137 TaxID=1314806 RepID=A0ACB8QFN5_9AGAM|nr:hypothetical protein K488DRAFT_87602 [Vararia minispora EC-137]